MKILSDLDIETLPPEIKKTVVKKDRESGQLFAFLYHINDDFSELIHIFTAPSEEELREEMIKNGHRYLSKRTFENFSKWYGRIGGKFPEEIELARKKFEL